MPVRWWAKHLGRAVVGDGELVKWVGRGVYHERGLREKKTSKAAALLLLGYIGAFRTLSVDTNSFFFG